MDLYGLRLFAHTVAAVINTLPNPSVRRTTQINLQFTCPEMTSMARHKLSACIIKNQCLVGVESPKCWAMPTSWSINQIHTVHNQDILEAALKHPKGTLIVAPHLGTWEILNAWLAQFGPATILYKPLKNKRLDDFVLNGRTHTKANLVPTNASGVKAIFRTLKNGGMSVILPDHVPRAKSGINVPFFAVNTLTCTLTPKLIHKTQCLIVGLACIRREYEQGFDIYCYKLDDAALYHNDLMQATIALNQAIQSIIEEHMAHYRWTYKRFKNVPKINNPYKSSSESLERFFAQRQV